MNSIRTTCPYCGVGCGLQMDSKSSELLGDTQHPANGGRLCVKGSALAETLGSQSRLLQPRVDGLLASWDHATSEVAKRLEKTLKRYGPESVAFYVSGQLLTEDYYVANKLIKGFLGSANIDTNSRLCMSTAVAAHKRVFGSDTVPGCYEDLELADLVVLTGSNMAWTHPVVFQRLMAAKQQRPEMTIVVIDPRRTVTAEQADLHLQIAPGSDVWLFDGLLAYLGTHDALDRQYIDQHTNGMDDMIAASQARSGNLGEIAGRCGLTAEELAAFYQKFAQTQSTVTVFSQGINQSAHGVDQASLILYCHLVTGRVGKPGSSPFSITGQPNAMGGREVGGLANMLAAHMDIDNTEHRALVGEFWRSDKLPEKPGLKAVDMFRAVADGKIKFIWIMATNPVVSLPESDTIIRALAGCDHVVVSDCVADTDTLRLAHIQLPAAAWGEKNGTVTNSERCISRQRAFLPLSGQALPDWQIISRVAEKLGYGHAFDYHCAADIFREHAALSGHQNNGSRDFDIGALATLSNAEYDQLTPIQWPVPAHQASVFLTQLQGTSRMLADGRFFTRDGRANVVPVNIPATLDVTDVDFPFVLNTGRIRDQWHTMTRTGLSSRLQRHISEPFVELNPEDMAELNITDGAIVRVSSAQGNCVVRARPQPGQKAGSAFMPIHWNDCFASQARVGALAPSRVDPFSGQPAFKQIPVMLQAVEVDWYALLITRTEQPLPENKYWSRRQMGDWQVVTLAGTEPVSMNTCRTLWGEHVTAWTEVEDDDGEHLRLLGTGENGAQLWFAKAPQPPQIDESWLLDALLAEDAAATSMSMPALLLGIPADQSAQQAGPLVCSCHNVYQSTVMAAIDAGCDEVEKVGSCCRAGTNCGSCIPEIKRLLAENQPAEAEEAVCCH
ncbi:nitrate reductase [Pseudohongiella sp. O18]|uniref:nitrate reductase n=1 Tax=Pseudohongiella sp. O18 TaxID=2904248 RepID=UPI0023515BB5|nr:nitrate reductase [Pseudohongiella sp. O18]